MDIQGSSLSAFVSVMKINLYVIAFSINHGYVLVLLSLQ